MQPREKTVASILVIDDDDQLRTFMRTVLEEDGHVVREARNGRVGVMAYQQEEADLVVCDIFMDEKEGLGTILDLRRQFGQVKIIAVSGGSSMFPQDYLQQARAFGALATLDKPLKRATFLGAVNRALPG